MRIMLRVARRAQEHACHAPVYVHILFARPHVRASTCLLIWPHAWHQQNTPSLCLAALPLLHYLCTACYYSTAVRIDLMV